MSNIPSWTNYFKQIATVTATRSPCKRLQVGCVLVKENRIIAQGYNGFLPGCIHESKMRDGHEMATIHAEQNAISDCAKRGVNCNDSTAYITHYPCINCMKILCASGINKINYIHNYNNDELVDYFSNITLVKVEQI
jgi:dCMP deaminase